MKLSELERNKTYQLTADDVQARLQVLVPGPMPVCALVGGIRSYLSEDDEPMIVQLIGWANWGDSLFTSQGYQLFSVDTQPDSAWLVGIRGTSNTDALMLLACAPEIKLVATD